MSLDITLTNRKTGTEVISMNWLRNPFGLCNWAEANVKPNTRVDLWYVCNNWDYDKSDRVDRRLFKCVVGEYWGEIQKLDRGYYAFDLPSYIQFVQPNVDFMPKETLFQVDRIKDAIYDKQGRLLIPMEHFNNFSAFHLTDPSLAYMRQWFAELVRFAELLQDKDNEFYCSN
jgi:hypothetical protein